jgi:hypothetical protein
VEVVPRQINIGSRPDPATQLPSSDPLGSTRCSIRLSHGPSLMDELQSRRPLGCRIERFWKRGRRGIGMPGHRHEPPQRLARTRWWKRPDTATPAPDPIARSTSNQKKKSKNTTLEQLPSHIPRRNRQMVDMGRSDARLLRKPSSSSSSPRWLSSVDVLPLGLVDGKFFLSSRSKVVLIGLPRSDHLLLPSDSTSVDSLAVCSSNVMRW